MRWKEDKKTAAGMDRDKEDGRTRRKKRANRRGEVCFDREQDYRRPVRG